MSVMFISTPALPVWVKPATKTMPTAAGDTPGALQGRTLEDFPHGAASRFPLLHLALSCSIAHLHPLQHQEGPSGSLGLLRLTDIVLVHSDGLNPPKEKKKKKIVMPERFFPADPNPPWSRGLGGRVPLEGAAGSACAPRGACEPPPRCAAPCRSPRTQPSCGKRLQLNHTTPPGSLLQPGAVPHIWPCCRSASPPSLRALSH